MNLELKTFEFKSHSKVTKFFLPPILNSMGSDYYLIIIDGQDVVCRDYNDGTEDAIQPLIVDIKNTVVKLEEDGTMLVYNIESEEIYIRFDISKVMEKEDISQQCMNGVIGDILEKYKRLRILSTKEKCDFQAIENAIAVANLQGSE